MNYWSYYDLDDISVVASGPPPAIPEPATLGLLLGSVTLIGLTRAGRRKPA